MLFLLLKKAFDLPQRPKYTFLPILLQLRLLLLDEPFSALDPLLRERLRDELLELMADLTIPAIIITHDPGDVDAFAGSLILYDHGQARMVPDYAELRPQFAHAGPCLRHLEATYWRTAA